MIVVDATYFRRLPADQLFQLAGLFEEEDIEKVYIDISCHSKRAKHHNAQPLAEPRDRER